MGELDDDLLGAETERPRSPWLADAEPAPPRVVQHSEPPATQAMAADAFAQAASFEEEAAAEESVSASFSSVASGGPAPVQEDPDTMTSARAEEEIEADGSVSFLSVDMESIAEEEATFLELGEDEFNEVEASRLVPIPDLGGAPARLPAPTPGGLPAARNVPLPQVQVPSAPVDGVPVSPQIRHDGYLDTPERVLSRPSE